MEKERMTVAEFKSTQVKPLKYRNVKTAVDGITFDSRKEAGRYTELMLLAAHGAISDLQIQPAFPLRVNGKLVCTYYADFSYYEGNKLVIEDIKSPITRKNPVYRIKRKLVAAVYGVEIREV